MRRLAFPFPRPIIGGVLQRIGHTFWVPAVGGTGSAVIRVLITEAHSWTFLLALLVGKCWQHILYHWFRSGGLVIPSLIHRCCLKQYAVWIGLFERKSQGEAKPSCIRVLAQVYSFFALENVPVATMR